MNQRRCCANDNGDGEPGGRRVILSWRTSPASCSVSDNSLYFSVERAARVDFIPFSLNLLIDETRRFLWLLPQDLPAWGRQIMHVHPLPVPCAAFAQRA